MNIVPKAMMTKADLVVILQILESVADGRASREYAADARRIAQNIKAQVIG